MGHIIAGGQDNVMGLSTRLLKELIARLKARIAVPFSGFRRKETEVVDFSFCPFGNYFLPKAESSSLGRMSSLQSHHLVY